MARGPFDAMVLATTVSAVVVLVAVGTSLFALPPAAWPGMLVIAVLPTAVAAITWRLRPRSFELWAHYRGELVELFESDDEKTYGHVRRALIRAREFDADTAAMARYVPAA